MNSNRCLRFSILPLLFALAACGGKGRPETPSAPVAADWKRTVTNVDLDRLRNWRGAFVKALEMANAAGHAGSIDREGALLNPDAALANPRPPAGNYRCRVIKLGGSRKAGGDYVVHPPYPCQLTDEGEVLGFANMKGPQRPVGLAFPADDRRMIFLGTMVLGDEARAMEYGRDSTRDMCGALERIGERRWRLILPQPRFESVMDVIELVPA